MYGLEDHMRLIRCVVFGVAPVDRNFFGGMAQRHLQETQRIDLRIDWQGGDEGTANTKVVVECCNFTFPWVKLGIYEALLGTYIPEPTFEHKPIPAVAQAA